ncbi:MAG: 16S rRNA (cytosine(1402)-N(4))-methyltransferase RsmH [Neisseria sp.]|nr:16S rRNA (cytosine(1402)-N(4))-methyltransferase RsmH [Neisseria sp.]
MEHQHITVLLHEAVAALAIRPDGVYVDGTFGRGGHSRLILQHLNAEGRLVVMDKDPQAIAAAQALAAEDARVRVVHDGFAHLDAGLDALQVGKIDGALFDLGLSSPQLDEAARGFSFRFDAPLDMRMDTTRGITAAQWLNSAPEAEIASVIRDAGEERFWRRIAAQIVAQRAEKPLRSTFDLAEICNRCVRTREKGQHPATRTFQAIRILINRELDEIAAMLPQAACRLNQGGRLAVIAFHSLEDRIVKRFMQEYSKPPELPRRAAVRAADLPEPPLKIIGRAMKPSAEEIAANPRARSAILRTAQRSGGAWRDE